MASTTNMPFDSTSHPEARTGAHDIMDGSGMHNTPYHTVIHGNVWPGMILDDDYVVTECYEESPDNDSPTFRWFCEPVATPVPRRQSGEPAEPAPEASEPPLARIAFEQPMTRISAAEAERIAAAVWAECEARSRRLEEMTGIPHPH